jgi:hypothetical protein
MALTDSKKSSPGENPAFVALMRMAGDNAGLKKQLLAILAQNDFNRQSMLNTYIEEMHIKQAPREFIEAIGCLLDFEIAQAAQALLKQDQ